jgi:hypothetical protein
VRPRTGPALGSLFAARSIAGKIVGNGVKGQAGNESHRGVNGTQCLACFLVDIADFALSMYRQKLGCSQMFRPRPLGRSQTNLDAQFHQLLLHTFSPGTYLRTSANAVLNHAFELHEKLLLSLIPQIASREAMDFILFQFDQGALIRHGKGAKARDEKDQWDRLEGCFGRAVKFLAELVCLASTNKANPSASKDDVVLAMEGAFYCAEKMCWLAELSERIHSLFPDQAFVKVEVLGSPVVWTGGFEGPNAGYDTRFFKRVERDRDHRSEILEGELERDLNAMPVVAVLDPVFERSLGVRLSQLFGCDSHYNQFCTAAAYRPFNTLLETKLSYFRLGESRFAGRSSRSSSSVMSRN